MVQTPVASFSSVSSSISLSRRRRKVANTMNSHEILVNLGLSTKNALHQPQVSVHMLRQPAGQVFTDPVGKSRVKDKLVGLLFYGLPTT